MSDFAAAWTNRNTPDEFGVTPMDYAVLSDLHKDVYGFRPQLNGLVQSIEDYNRIFTDLQRRLDDTLAEEAAAEAAMVRALNERLEKLIAIGAKDRKMAMRWLLESDGKTDDRYGYEDADYAWGLPYGTCKAILHRG